MKKTLKNPKPNTRLDSVREKLSAKSVDGPELIAVSNQLAEMSSDDEEALCDTVKRGAKLLALVSELAANWDEAAHDNATDRNELIAFLQDGVMVLDDALSTGQREQEIQELIDLANENWSDYLLLFDDSELNSRAESDVWQTDDAPEDQEEIPDSGQIAMMLQALSGDDADVEPPKANKAPSKAVKTASRKETASRKKTASPNKNSTKDFIPQPPEGADVAAAQALADDPEMLEAYLDDALRCVASMEQASLQVEQDASDREPIQQFCRELHTLKGASATVGLSELAAYLHELESSLETIFDDETLTVDADPLFAAVDQVRSLVESLQPAQNIAPAANGSVAPVAQPAKDYSGLGSTDDASIRIRASKLDRLMDMLAELVVLRNHQESDVSDFDELNEELTRCSARISVANDRGMAELSNEANPLRTLELGQSSAVLSEVSKDIAAVSQGLRDLQKPIVQNSASISRFIRNFRQELMQLRRVPVSSMFSRLQRAARDAAKSEDKKVRVELIGENAGLEQEIQERLYESLLHVVRNSVSHGIESESQRVKLGKDSTGTITLEATSNAQLLIIEVRDDGGGIDFDAVRKRATQKGLIAAGQDMTQNQLGKLIFHPGFSTRESASPVSGRGVGMDIVATTIGQLKGRIEVDSERKLGTTIRILIPLKSGIEHVMVFRSGQQLFALPMQAVSSAKRETTKNGIAIAQLFGTENQPAGDSGEILQIRRSSLQPNSANKTLDLVVDELLGPEEVVVRKLPNLLRQHPFFDGITLSGSGKKVLLLDAERFADHCETMQAEECDRVEASESDSDQKVALVVDDSLTARRALSKVLRKFGFHVTEAGDGEKAVELLRKQTFDLVLTDLDMPRMGGLELLSDIQSGNYCDAPKVVVSSRNEQAFKEQALEAGADEYITKPISNASIEQLLVNLELADSVKGKTQ